MRERQRRHDDAHLPLQGRGKRSIRSSRVAQRAGELVPVSPKDPVRCYRCGASAAEADLPGYCTVTVTDNVPCPGVFVFHGGFPVDRVFEHNRS